jgi:seryl-tRNA synthetase
MATKKNETSAVKKKVAETTNFGKHSLHNLYDECNSHLRSLDFYKQELKYLQKRLADIVKRNTDSDILAQAEQFQNKFIITKDNLDELNHTIKSQFKTIEKLIKQKPSHVDEQTIGDSSKFSQSTHNAEKDFASLKLQFNKFLAKYL